LDGLGSVTEIALLGGIFGARYLYRAFGETTALSENLQSPFRWVGSLGYYYDADLLEYYLRARDYSPASARFLSRDPLGFEGGDPNLFRYVSNNPVNLIDPSGLVRHCTLAKPPVILPGGVEGPTASAGGISVGVSTNPGVVNYYPTTTILCTRRRLFNVRYDCTERYGFCYIWTSTTSPFITQVQTQHFRVHVGQSVALLLCGASIPIPRVPLANVSWHGFCPGEQARANTICANASAPAWPKYTPPPTHTD
jgi:RHS repeat-associated protein